jgi:MIP family channel proteins
MNESLTRRCIAEFLSTFCLVLLGCGAMAVDSRTQALTHVGVAIAWGLVVMVMIYAVGGISGAHMNPAVTIGFTTLGRLPVKDALGYVPAQCLGALAGALAIRAVLGVDQSMLGSTNVQLDLGLTVGLVIEFGLTFILMFVVIGVSTGGKEETITAALAVGSTIALAAMVAGPLTKASMNPARSLGPAVIAGDISELWLYCVGPIAGAIAGGITAQVLHAGRNQTIDDT